MASQPPAAGFNTIIFVFEFYDLKQLLIPIMLNSQQEIRYLLFKLIHFAFKMERNFWHNFTYPRNYQHNNQKG